MNDQNKGLKQANVFLFYSDHLWFLERAAPLLVIIVRLNNFILVKQMALGLCLDVLNSFIDFELFKRGDY